VVIKREFMNVFNAIFGKSGELSRILPKFEPRDEQCRMAEFVLECLKEGENGLVEAGTGIGKTFAYLVPILLHAVEKEKKILLSTETKTLQRQLVDKDIPLIKKLFNDYFGIDFTFSLCLGSSNYPCFRRFQIALSRGKLSQADAARINAIYKKNSEHKVTTRFDFPLSNAVWSEIHREADACSYSRCPFSSRCSYLLARKEWSRSTLLVMNHYLFFSDVAMGKTYLPQTEIALFDEAHSLEEIGASQLGISLKMTDLEEILNVFYRGKKRHHLLHYVDDQLLRKKIIGQIKKTSSETGKFFEKIRSMIPHTAVSFRIREALSFGGGCVKILQELVLMLAECETYFNNDENLRVEFEVARGKLFLFTESLAQFVYFKNENYVYWIEKNAAELLGDIIVRGQPIDIHDIMQKDVMEYYDSSLLVSATLSINENFSYIIKRLGVTRYRSITLKSTFDFMSQMLLYISKDNNDPMHEQFIIESTCIVSEIINALNGNCLVLFTSYKMLSQVKKILNEHNSHPIFSQDEMTPADALSQYIANDNSVLLGTHSFWQGIDLPGDLLRGVIMMKLPFSVPDSPPIQARMEKIEEGRGNPFYDYQIPEAVIKFRQGFGRLIRSSKDFGIVAVMDPRIYAKPYGKLFLKSLPDCKIVYSFEELRDGYNNLAGRPEVE